MLYYLPGPDADPDPATLAACGLAAAFEGAPVRRGCHGGPDGGSGVILAQPGTPRIGYFAADQTWRKIPGTARPELELGEAWVGYAPAARPTPDSLARTRGTLEGHEVRLADGQRWHCPAAVRVDPDADLLTRLRTLPSVIELDEAGQWTSGGVHPDWQPLWRIAERYYELKWAAMQRIAGEQAGEETCRGRFDFPTLNADAAKALAVNYRLIPAAVSLLGLFDSRSAAGVLDALVDWPTLLLWVEKKSAAAAAGCAPSPGPVAAAVGTAPRSPTCTP